MSVSMPAPLLAPYIAWRPVSAARRAASRCRRKILPHHQNRILRRALSRPQPAHSARQRIGGLLRGLDYRLGLRSRRSATLGRFRGLPLHLLHCLVLPLNGLRQEVVRAPELGDLGATLRHLVAGEADDAGDDGKTDESRDYLPAEEESALAHAHDSADSTDARAARIEAITHSATTGSTRIRLNA